MKLFSEIHKKTNKTIIIITHDMDLVYQYFNRVIVLKDGELSFDGTPDTLFRSNLLEKNHLDYPNTIKTIRHINKSMNLNFDVFQKNRRRCY